MKLFGSSCHSGFGVIVEFIPPSMAATNKHRRGAACPGNISIDNLEEGDGDFVIHYENLMRDDSAPIINILELFKQTGFIDADKKCDDR